MRPIVTLARDEDVDFATSRSSMGERRANRHPEVTSMLAVSTYSQDYVDACRARVRDTLDAFEPQFLAHMVLALDAYFVHRVRNKELKDGNPLNEVRLLATSIMSNDGLLVADKQVKLDPESSILGLAPGDPIVLDADDFARLSEAYFDEIERKYVAVSAPA
jgi:hypothetical protein